MHLRSSLNSVACTIIGQQTIFFYNQNGEISVLLNLKKLEKMASAIASVLPSQNEELRKELKTNIKPILSSMFKKMDVVTREDFELQRSILRKTREKLEQLELKIAAMEKKK